MTVIALCERYSSSKLCKGDKAVGEISVNRFDGRASNRSEVRDSSPSRK